MSSGSNGSSGGVGILGVLGIVFVVLKLTDVIDWSWWWVTLPFWGPVALLLGYGLLVLVISAVKRS